jgi:hypothetical protein
MTEVDTHELDRPRRTGMRPATKLAAFALVLGVAFGAGAAVGAVVGPLEVTDPEPVHDTGPGAVHGTEDPGPTTTVVPGPGHDDHDGADTDAGGSNR